MWGHNDKLLLVGEGGALERGFQFKLTVQLLFLLRSGEALRWERGQGFAPVFRTFFVLKQSLYQPSQTG